MKRAVRMGIDVGGTHTKAVAIDNATHEVIGKSSVKTTHHHPEGVVKRGRTIVPKLFARKSDQPRGCCFCRAFYNSSNECLD